MFLFRFSFARCKKKAPQEALRRAIIHSRDCDVHSGSGSATPCRTPASEFRGSPKPDCDAGLRIRLGDGHGVCGTSGNLIRSGFLETEQKEISIMSEDTNRVQGVAWFLAGLGVG